MLIKNVGIIGSGLMGEGIALVFAQSGFNVKITDVSEKQLRKSIDSIDVLLEKKVLKNKINSIEKKAILKRIITISDMEDLSKCQLIIEAVPEIFNIKIELYNKLNSFVNDTSIIASNTSSISITKLAKAITNPKRFIGMHFFYPAPLMNLVELIKGLQTSQDTFDVCSNICIEIGKQPVNALDFPGFLVNRLLTPLMNEAINCVMEGASPQDVDKAMKLGANFPMGPIELADYVGLDTLLSTQIGLYEGFRDSKYRPSPLLVNMVEGGLLGRKTGKGFYSYD